MLVSALFVSNFIKYQLLNNIFKVIQYWFLIGTNKFLVTSPQTISVWPQKIETYENQV